MRTPAASAAVACILAVGLPLAWSAFPNPWEALPPPYDEHSLCIEGPLGDATCDAQAVERANSEQLHSVLQELTDTTFFRLFRVNLHGECPFERIKAFDTSSCGAPTPKPEAAAAGAPLFMSDLESPGSSCAIEAAHHHGLLHDEVDITTDLVDTFISQAEGAAAVAGQAVTACDDEDLPEFWVDMCARIPTTAGELVNLKLNPESDTGYNGSHIWAAIYQENCFVRANEPDSMCLEERVLYRILSGMHASTNIHVAMHHNASHSLHPDAVAVFRKHFGSVNSQRLRDLHFAFVVLLRGVQKGADYLRSLSFAEGALSADDAEAARAARLVDRLLDSCILQSCASVFSAFDEATLFQRPHEHTWWSLKRQFKGVFHNISSIVDCVSCQKCRLHGKLQLLGVGTALKWLLLPSDLIASATTRDEVVALVNTLSKFSRAITWSKQLAERARREDFEAARDRERAMASPTLAALTDGSEAAAPTVEPKLVDLAVSLIAGEGRKGNVNAEEESALLRLALGEDPKLLTLVRHYGADAARHLALLAHAVASQPSAQTSLSDRQF